MLKAIGWFLYASFGLLATYLALMIAGPWFGLTLALCFIFGPKVWRSL